MIVRGTIVDWAKYSSHTLPASRRAGDRACFVYVVCPMSYEAPVKVGLSYNPHYRLNELQTGSAVELQIAATFECSNREVAQRLERMFHDNHAAQRLRGEWFNIEPDDAADFLGYHECHGECLA